MRIEINGQPVEVSENDRVSVVGGKVFDVDPLPVATLDEFQEALTSIKGLELTHKYEGRAVLSDRTYYFHFKANPEALSAALIASRRANTKISIYLSGHETIAYCLEVPIRESLLILHQFNGVSQALNSGAPDGSLP